MASRAALRDLFYVFLGTKASDPAFPATTANALLNQVSKRYQAELRLHNPQYAQKVVTLTSATDTYALPADFGGWLDVRLTDSRGLQLAECRAEELQSMNVPAFTIVGPSQTASLITAPSVAAGRTLWLRYTYLQGDLATDTDEPTWMPAEHHHLIAREAAIDAAGIGAEQLIDPVFLERTEDARAIYWSTIGRRGPVGLGVRS